MGATDVKVVEDSVKELLAKGLTGQAIDLLIATGHGHHISIGALTTPIVGGGAGTTIAIDQPQGLLGIGGNQAIIPVRIKVECEAGLVAADSEVDEILIGVDADNSPDGINETTVVNEDVYNMLPHLGKSQVAEVQAWSAVTTALTTAPVIDMELDRAQQFRELGSDVGLNHTQLELLYEPLHPPILTAKADGLSLMIYWGGTVAVSGFAQVQVVVFPSVWVKAISG